MSCESWWPVAKSELDHPTDSIRKASELTSVVLRACRGTTSGVVGVGNSEKNRAGEEGDGGGESDTEENERGRSGRVVVPVLHRTRCREVDVGGLGREIEGGVLYVAGDVAEELAFVGSMRHACLASAEEGCDHWECYRGTCGGESLDIEIAEKLTVAEEGFREDMAGRHDGIAR